MSNAYYDFEYKISPGQVTKISILANQVFPTLEDFKNNLESMYGVRSKKKLTYNQASELIDALEKSVSPKPQKEAKNSAVIYSIHNPSKNAGGTSPSTGTIKKRKKRKYRGSGFKGNVKHITEPQAYRIEELEKLLGWNSKSTHEFVAKQLSRKRIAVFTGIEMLMISEATKVIVGMQRVLSNSSPKIYKIINDLKLTELKLLCRSDIDKMQTGDFTIVNDIYRMRN